MKSLHHAPPFSRIFFVGWQGKLAEALPLLEKSLAIRKQVLGDDHPKVAESLNNIASVYQDQVL